jgi:hypothetical protein
VRITKRATPATALAGAVTHVTVESSARIDGRDLVRSRGYVGDLWGHANDATVQRRASELAAEIEAGRQGARPRGARPPVRGARPMTALADLSVGDSLYEAGVYYDDGDNPIAREGPSSYAPSERRAEAFARAALRGRRRERPGGFWYATIRRGRVVDPIGDGHTHDHVFERDPDWSRTLLGEEEQ